jgi:hypothetical protein
MLYTHVSIHAIYTYIHIYIYTYIYIYIYIHANIHTHTHKQIGIRQSTVFARYMLVFSMYVHIPNMNIYIYLYTIHACISHVCQSLSQPKQIPAAINYIHGKYSIHMESLITLTDRKHANFLT